MGPEHVHPRLADALELRGGDKSLRRAAGRRIEEGAERVARQVDRVGERLGYGRQPHAQMVRAQADWGEGRLKDWSSSRGVDESQPQRGCGAL